MFCAKCGAALRLDPDGILRCTTGGLEYSRHLGRQLLEAYAHVPGARSGPAAPPATSFQGLFCPGCGHRVGTDAYCKACGVSMKPFLWPLVELHPHLGADGRSF